MQEIARRPHLGIGGWDVTFPVRDNGISFALLTGCSAMPVSVSQSLNHIFSSHLGLIRCLTLVARASEYSD
jgi:hypothetical protein